MFDVCTIRWGLLPAYPCSTSFTFLLYLYYVTHTHFYVYMRVYYITQSNLVCPPLMLYPYFIQNWYLWRQLSRVHRYSDEEIKPVVSADFKSNSWSSEPRIYHLPQSGSITSVSARKLDILPQKILAAEKDTWAPKCCRRRKALMRTLGTRVFPCCQLPAGLALPQPTSTYCNRSMHLSTKEMNLSF